MNVFEYAIITTANAMQPGDEGYEPAQRFSRDVVKRLTEPPKVQPSTKQNSHA